MFHIKSYLQFKNTPDGNPRVLTQGKEYDYAGCEKGEVSGLFEEIEGGLLSIANLADCRPLLTVEIDGAEIRELTLVRRLEDDQIGLIYFDGFSWRIIVNYLEKENREVSNLNFEINLYDFFGDNYKIIGTVENEFENYAEVFWNKDTFWEKLINQFTYNY